MESGKGEAQGEHEPPEAEPQIYGVQREQSAWSFHRRRLLAAAGATGVAAIAGACGPGASEPTATPSAAELARQEACHEVRAHADSVNALAVSPDSSLLATGGLEGLVKLWTLPDGGFLRVLEGLSGSVRALAISPDGALLYAGNSDQGLTVWTLHDGTQVQTKMADSGSVTNLSLAAAASLLATGGGDLEVRLWSLPGLALVGAIEQGSVPWNLALSPDGTLLAVPNSGVVSLWSLPEGTPLEGVEAKGVRTVVFSPDGTLLAYGGLNDEIILWSLPRGKRATRLAGHEQWVNALTFSPDGKLLASAGTDKTVRLWSVPDGKLLRTLEGHTQSVIALDISPDGRWVISGSGDGSVRMWSLPGGALSACLMDMAANEASVQGSVYTRTAASGAVVHYTLPCGSPIPAGAVCTCNCVAGGFAPAVVPAGHYWYPC